VGGAAHTVVELVEGVIVHPDRMRTNLGPTGGALVGGPPAVALAPVLGGVRAGKLPTAGSAEAADTGRPFREVLTAGPELSVRFTPAEPAELPDPAHRTGRGRSTDRPGAAQIALHRHEILRGHENDGGTR
jgi:3-carboxy-cis,cis-muconate cycloisomerase